MENLNQAQDPNDLELVDYIPRVCEEKDGQPAKFKGKVILSLPGFIERTELLRQLADIEIGLHETNEISDKRERITKTLNAVKGYVGLIAPFVHKVEIERVSDGAKITSVKRLEKIADFDADFLLMIKYVARNGLLDEKKEN